MHFGETFAARIQSGSDRWKIIEDFVASWYDAPILPEHGCAEDEIRNAEERIGLRLPDALRTWYLLTGKNLHIASQQDRFLSLDHLRSLDEWYGRLVVRIENQGCVQWGILSQDLTLPDPPIHLFDGRKILGCENKTTSEFLLFTVIYETIFSTGHSAWTDDVLADEALGRFPDLGLPPASWPTFPTRLRGGDDCIVIDSADSGWTWITAKTHRALIENAALMPVDWNLSEED